MKCTVLRNQGFPLQLLFTDLAVVMQILNLIYLYRQSKEIVTIFQRGGVVMATYINWII